MSHDSEAVMSAIADTAVQGLLRERGGAVVLERIARGGGAARWFRCASASDLQSIAARLSPGSRVSFYFDARLPYSPYSAEVAREIFRVMEDEGEAVVGTLGGRDRA